MLRVSGKDLGGCKEAIDKVASANGPHVRLRLALVLQRVKRALKDYQFSVQPSGRYQEFLGRELGLLKRFGNEQSNGFSVPLVNQDKFQKAMLDLKDDFAEDIAKEFSKKAEIREIEEKAFELDLPGGCVKPKWVRECSIDVISILLENGFIDSEKYFEYVESMDEEANGKTSE